MKAVLIFFILVGLTLAEENYLDEFSKGNHRFTAAVYKELQKKEKGNFLVSPLSAEIVLALTQVGAKNATSEQLRKSLFLPNTDEKIEASIKDLQSKLQTRKGVDDFTLSSANKIYVNDKFEVVDEFKKAAVDNFGSDIENINFGDNAGAAAKINDWVESKTNKKITDLVDPKQVNDDTKLLLINALYFYAKWEHQFDPQDTKKRAFFQNGVEQTLVDSMLTEDDFNYYECSKVDAKFVELPYVGDDSASMTIVLPNKKDGLPLLEQNLESVLEGRNYTKELVRVILPKFSLRSTIKFVPILKELGIKDAFTPDADFSGISKAGKLYISDVIQKTYIDVAEKGTEAAAATAVHIALLSAIEYFPPRMVYQFTVDHPFICYIKKDDVVLFAGRVTSL